MLLLALLLGLWCLAPMQSIAAPAPSAAPASLPAAPPAAGGASLSLVSVSPSALGPGATLTAQVAVTNTSSTAILAPRLELRSLRPRVTQRATLQAWQGDTRAEVDGTAAATSPAGADLAPGQQRTFTVTVPADSLGYSPDPSLWGARRLALTLVSATTPGGEAADNGAAAPAVRPVATLRTFTVWRPPGVSEQIAQSVLVPVTAADPGLAAVDPQAFAASATTGALHRRLQLAQRPDVDWLLDPALLDPPALATPAQRADGSTATATSAPATSPSAAPTSTTAPAASPSAASSPAAETSASSAPVAGYAPAPAGTALARALSGSVFQRTVLTYPYARADLVSLQAASTPELQRMLQERASSVLSGAGIASSGTVIALPGTSVTGAQAQAAQEAGAQVLLAPAPSLQEDPAAAVTPSSVADLVSEQGATPVLAPDPVLSSQLSSLSSSTSAPGTTQRMLAETAVIASQPATAARHLLLSPTATADLDPGAVATALDALDAAPWIRPARTADLLDTGTAGSFAESPGDTDGGLYALGSVDPEDLHPSAPDASGTWVHTRAATTPPLLDAASLRSLESTLTRLQEVTSTMKDTAATDVPMLTGMSAASEQWRGSGGTSTVSTRTARARTEVDALASAITVEPASSYTLVASSAGVPLTLTNDLDTPVTVALTVASDQQVVRLPQRTRDVTIPARGSVETKVPVEALANGSVHLRVQLRTPGGAALGPTRDVALSVNPSWENWTTMVLVIAMGVLVVIGVLRARRTGSERRAPAVRGPEDPATLARTGLSAPPPGPERDAAPTDTNG